MKRSAPSVLACLLLEAAVLAAAASGADPALWRYLDSAEPPPEDWRADNFDDAAWRSGPAPLGYGDSGLATELRWGNDPARKPITAWFRRTVELPALRPGERAVLVCCVDDGAAIYLNGREIARVNLPDGARATCASHALSDRDEGFYVRLPVPADALRPGRNVLAAEVHQCAPDSSDLFFDLALHTVSAPAPAVPDAARRVVDLYRTKHRVGPEDAIPDGYLDGGRRMAIGTDGRADSAREILCVDRGRDAALRGWLTFAGSAELKVLPPLDRARRLAAFVDAACTPPGGLRWLERTCEQLEREFADKPVLLGEWLNQSHAGVCRHRALLFKLLADEAGLKSALVRGNLAPDEPHIWNELTLEDGRRVIVDVMQLGAQQTFADVASPGVIQRYRRVDNAPWYEGPAPQAVP